MKMDWAFSSTTLRLRLLKFVDISHVMRSFGAKRRIRNTGTGKRDLVTCTAVVLRYGGKLFQALQMNLKYEIQDNSSPSFPRSGDASEHFLTTTIAYRNE